jgi:hypothetical protein
MLAGKLERKLKSAPVPEENDGPVKIVVGTTYEEIVMDPTKHVFLRLYAPWHDKDRPFTQWEELGKAMQE